jgi:hypothetical protein
VAEKSKERKQDAKYSAVRSMAVLNENGFDNISVECVS